MRTGVSFPSFASQAAYTAIANTNWIQQSQTLENASWTRDSGGTGAAPTVTANYATAPDGTLTADRVQFNAGAGPAGGFARIQQTVSGLTAAALYTQSIWMKTNNGTTKTIYIRWAGTGHKICTVTPTWTRFDVNATGNGSSADVFQVLAWFDGPLGPTSTGALDFSLWGGQLNPGNTVRPYIPTTTAAVTTTVDAMPAYPLSNLSDLRRPRRVAKYAAAGGGEFTFLLPAAQQVQFIGLVHHNAQAPDAFRIVLFSDTSANPMTSATNMVHDSGWQNFPVPTPGLTHTRPYALAAAVSCRSGYIQLADTRSTYNAAWQLGAVEVAGFWGFTDVAVDRTMGFSGTDQVAELPFNTDHATDSYNPRIWAGSRKVVDQSEPHTTLLDFQLEKGMANPFVFCWDADDINTMEREAFLARNKSLPPGVANDYPAGAVAFDLIEHLR